MLIKYTRPVITPSGMTEVVFVYDTNTNTLDISKNDAKLLKLIYDGVAQDIPELSDWGTDLGIMLKWR